ncbi:MAG: ribosome silencing factor [Planctomycetaceae bacterium]|jgi:ribosome-associated protein|nr:ribosome silencing factor [Planctomycetaceae bacterium]
MAKSEKTNISTIPPVLDRVFAAAKTAEENRGSDIVILDVRELTKAFDFFLIVSGSSRRQLYSIGDEIQKKLAGEMNDICLSVAGHTEGKWIVIDYGDIIVHLFEPETRNYYALEELWGKAERVNVMPPQDGGSV